ncbi:MAG TPA: NUDIX hydrolase [Novosphingobium sp.]
MTSTPAPSQGPRLSASALVIRDNPLEVLMIARHAEQDFASALVFPGGLVDPADAADDWLAHVRCAEGLSRDERALRIAACRETFEECGLLLARRRDGSEIDEAIDPDGDLKAILAQHDALLCLDALVHFGHWITPEVAPRRYDTHFYLVPVPAGQVARCDGQEAIEAIWVEPAATLSAAAAGTRKVLFPTRMNLSLLSRTKDATSALTEARERPVVTVRPWVEKRENGVAVVIPESAGYGQTEYLHPNG